MNNFDTFEVPHGLCEQFVVHDEQLPKKNYLSGISIWKIWMDTDSVF